MNDNVQYLASHDVAQVVDEVIGTLCKIKPANPWQLLSREFDAVSKRKVDTNVIPKVVFVLGGPGCGKGTQCDNIIKNFNAKHFSAGDLLRAEVVSGSEQGKQLDEWMKQGKIVPGEITIGLLKKAIATVAAGTEWVLIDGFPREMGQALQFEATVAECHFVLSFVVSDEVMTQRLLKRGETSGRADDNMATIKKRFDTFHKQSEPVLEYFKALGKLESINAERSVDAIWEDVKNCFTPKKYPKVVFVLGGPGSGKGTQCERIIKQFGVKHLSAGDLLRDEQKSGTPLGNEIASVLKEGRLVRGEIIIELLKKNIAAAKNVEWVLVDGFPREMRQCLDFEKQITKPDFVLAFDAPDDVLVQRLIKRGETSGRSDDNVETIKQRLKTFHNQSVAVIEYYKALGKVKLIAAEGPAEDIWAHVKVAFEK